MAELTRGQRFEEAATGRRRLLRPAALPVAAGLLGVCIVLGASLGPTAIAPAEVLQVIAHHLFGLDSQVSPPADAIVWQIRLPRVLLAGLVGGTLAISGAAYQGVFRNPLADPYLLGVATGAGLAATIAIVLEAPLLLAGFSLLPAIAFAGAVASVLLTYSIARAGGRTPNTTLLLAGVALASVSVSAISYLMLVDRQNTTAILSWLLGSFNDSAWRDLLYVAPYALPAAGVVFLHARLLNALQLEESQAQLVGVSVERTKAVVLLAASLATAAAVALAGVIGFVGLIVPHAVRLLIGPDYRRLLPVAWLLGAGFLILADLGARTLARPSELPVGIITSFFGAPFFLFLLRRQGRAYF